MRSVTEFQRRPPSPSGHAQREKLRTSCTNHALRATKEFATESPSFNATVRMAKFWRDIDVENGGKRAWKKGAFPTSTLLELQPTLFGHPSHS